MSTTISSVSAIEVLDSRGFPTVEVCVSLESGDFETAIVPSGASTGKKEACELRDGDKSRYLGKGVLRAVSNVNNQIASAIVGLDATNVRAIDNLLIEIDGTKDKSNLGANAILAVSMAVAKVAANAYQLPFFKFLGGSFANVLPVPMMNIINGGAHASNGLAIQEFMIAPVFANKFSDVLKIGSEVFHTLKGLLVEKGFGSAVGDEGGFAPSFSKSKEALDFIMSAIEKAGYKPGKDVLIALDAASSEFFENEMYHIDGERMNSSDLISYYKNLVANYPIYSIEDAMCEDDPDGFVQITKELGSKIQIVGDDLFCTNKNILESGIKACMANAILIKPNQIGTLSETIDTIELAKRNKYGTIISHRSGETEDVTIAELAVATNAGQIKTGSLSRSERIAKYNQLLRIEQLLGQTAVYPGYDVLFEYEKNK